MSETGETVCTRFHVFGRVQGVYFRASTATEACRLGVRGRAINQPDGCVEVLAIGTRADVDALAAWLQHGPPLADVRRVVAESLDPRQWTAVAGFRTG